MPTNQYCNENNNIIPLHLSSNDADADDRSRSYQTYDDADVADAADADDRSRSYRTVRMGEWTRRR